MVSSGCEVSQVSLELAESFLNEAIVKNATVVHIFFGSEICSCCFDGRGNSVSIPDSDDFSRAMLLYGMAAKFRGLFGTWELVEDADSLGWCWGVGLNDKEPAVLRAELGQLTNLIEEASRDLGLPVITEATTETTTS